MSHPLLMIKPKEILDGGMFNFVSEMEKLKKKIKAKKAKLKKATKKPVASKKKVKKIKVKLPVEPVRSSPFSIGDEVWLRRSTDTWVKTKIMGCIKPPVGQKTWRYRTAAEETWDESDFLPVSIFSLMATDAVRMKTAVFTKSLNDTFDADVLILAVYRTGQKKPWAYYVIPDTCVLYTLVKWTKKNYYGVEDHSAKLYIGPVKQLNVKFTPVSSAPQEILTYLGLHVYNRQWTKENQNAS